MKIICNFKLNLNNETLFNEKNGRTRRTLVVINKNVKQIESNVIIGKLGFLNKGNHSFIFINPSNDSDDYDYVGLYLNNSYGYDVVDNNNIIFQNNSTGGYGNSESKFGIYKPNCVIIENTYKNRQTRSIFKLDSNSWMPIETFDYYKDEIVLV